MQIHFKTFITGVEFDVTAEYDTTSSPNSMCMQVWIQSVKLPYSSVNLSVILKDKIIKKLENETLAYVYGGATCA